MQEPGIDRPIVNLSESAEKPSLLCDRLRSQNCFQNSEAVKPKGRVALPKRMKFQKSSKGGGGFSIQKIVLQILDL